MHTEIFNNTTIGLDYLKTNQFYPTDLLLDYLSGLLKMKADTEVNELWRLKYTHEIEAVKEILRLQTTGTMTVRKAIA
jgi:hypothetical protein